MSRTQHADADVEKNVDDNWQRRQYLQQIVESYDRARQTLTEASLSRDPGDCRTAAALLCDLIRLTEPLLQGHALWEQTIIARVNLGATGSVEIVGLFDILEYEEGIEYSAEVSTPGSGSNTKTEIKRRPLPYEVLNKAFRKLTKFLYEIDVLTTPDSENDATAVDKI